MLQASVVHYKLVTTDCAWWLNHKYFVGELKFALHDIARSKMMCIRNAAGNVFACKYNTEKIAQE